jgi:hypothetical protein
MGKIIEITALTLKRLENYHQVIDNELKDARKLQWTNMTLDHMQTCDVAVKKADHIAAAVGYANLLFKIQNGLISERALFGEQLLLNILVPLLNELRIPIVMIDAPEQTSESSLSN